jgi:hypothetical protein
MVLTRLPLYVGTALPSSTPVGAPRASPAGNDLSAGEIVVAYHERTKHHYHRFAASVGYMDWATQPDPFRRARQQPDRHKTNAKRDDQREQDE